MQAQSNQPTQVSQPSASQEVDINSLALNLKLEYGVPSLGVDSRDSHEAKLLAVMACPSGG